MTRLTRHFALALLVGSPLPAQRPFAARDTLGSCLIENIPAPVRCGTFFVSENRQRPGSRRIPLRVVVLPARKQPARPDPVFSIYGGPGQTATDFAAQEWTYWYRDDRDVVLIDQRGTSADAALDCGLSGSQTDAQGYLEPMFQPALFRACRRELEQKYDLTQYTTPIAADDLEELRRRLGYDEINIHGGSYGARMALVYVKLHPEHVRSVTLRSLTPFSFRNPLYHAKAAQTALDSVFSACEHDEACRTAFPKLRSEFAGLVERLAAKPAPTQASHPATGKQVMVQIGRAQFGEGLRTMMYRPDRAALVPLLVHRAFEGDLRPFADAALASNYGLRTMLRFGMLMSTTCSEDVARITEADIVRETRNTFLGDDRVRQQIAACREWPVSPLPADYAQPVIRSVPALLISAAGDPATPPFLGEEVRARYFAHANHLVVPLVAHSVQTPCLFDVAKAFLATASVRDLETSCVEKTRWPPFVIR